ncbi:hypothetical protein Bca52824_027990 [Brassica carinata]|uniref:TF-B3 domain-containing protein n=1 Tax=Brassica carinata TaxID=52824 RepID=A0A8X8AP41_BRACI|nr:hypothetical protein Bca52824_027990 [Brassica carinata]
MYLSVPFMRANGMTKPRLLTLVGKDGVEWKVNLKEERSGRALFLGKGWKEFAKANGLKKGEYFTLESAWKNEIPMLSLVNTESTSGIKQRGESSKAMEKERSTDTSSIVQNRVVTLALETKDVKACTLYLSVPFMRANGMTKPRLLTLVGKDGVEWKVNLKEERSGRALFLGKGWKEFAKANGLKKGEYFTLESAWKNEIPMLSLVNTESTSGIKQRGESSKAMEKERSTDTSSIVQNRVVTLALETKDVKACTLHLPSEFVTAVGIKKLGKISLLGKDGMKWWGCLLSRNGTVAVGIGWRNFCEANGKIPQKKNRKREEESSSLDPSCFLANIWPSSLRYDTLNLPKSFVRANGLETSCGGEIVLMNEKGTSWTLALNQKLCGVTYIRRGWRSFCSANGLKTGGLYTFKLIQRGRTPILRLSSKDSESEERNFEKIQRKKAESSSLDPSCFVANISRATLCYDTLYLPVKFSRENGLDTRCGEIVLMNEKGRTWKLKLKRKRSCGTMYITRGWRSFCSANGLRAGSSFTFKLIKKGGTLVLRLSPKEREEDCSSEANEVESLSTETESDEESSQDDRKIKKHRSTWKASSSQSQNRLVTLTLRPFNLEKYSLYIPKIFARANGLETRCGEIVLMNETGRSWNLNLKRKNSCGTMYITRGWRRFCRVNGLRAGSFFTFKLIQRRGTLVLRVSPSSTESEYSSEDDEERNQDEKSFKKSNSIWKTSSSPIQSIFVTLTLKPHDVKRSRLYLPLHFTRRHGINEETKMTLLDKNGVKWSTDPRSEKPSARIRLVGGWKEFFKANCVEIGESIMLKLIWEGDTSCILKFCSKVKQETR